MADADAGATLVERFVANVTANGFTVHRGVAPVIDAVIPLPEAELAHRRMAAGDPFGKLVLSVPPV